MRARIGRIAGWLDRNDRRIVAALCAITLLAGLAYALVLGEDLRYADEADYVALARSLLAGHGFSLDGAAPTAFRPPGYPLILAAPLALGAPIWVLRLPNFLALAAALMLAHGIAAREFGRPAGALAALMVVAYPVLFYAAGTLFPQIIGAALLLLVIDLALRERAGAVAVAAGGATFGVLAVTVAGLPAHAFVMAGCVALVRTRARMRMGLLFLAAALLVMGVWTARNAVAFGRFVPTSTTVGLNLLLGNSPNSTATSGRDVEIWMYEARAEAMDEVERDAFFRDQALAWMRDNPARAAALYAQKVLNHFSYRNDLVTAGESGNWQDAVMFATYYGLLVLVLLRLIWAARGRALSRFEVALLVLYVAHAAITAVFFTRIRHRLPFDCLLILIAAGVLWTGLQALARPAPGRAPRQPAGASAAAPVD